MSLLKDKVELAVAEAELEANKQFGSVPTVYKIVIIVAVIGIIPGFFLTRFISHKIWAGRYANLLITAKPSYSNPQNLQIQQSSVINTGNNTYAVAAIIKNNNLGLSLSQQPYQFKLLDSSGLEVSPTNDVNLSGNLFILPGDTKYLVLPKLVSSVPIAQAELIFPANLNWQNKLFIPQIKLTATDPAMFNQSNPQAFVVQGDIINNSAYQINQVTINFLLYDQTGKLVGASQRSEYTIQPNERRTYKQLWPYFDGSNVTRVAVVPETNVFDNSNISVPVLPNRSSLN